MNNSKKLRYIAAPVVLAAVAITPMLGCDKIQEAQQDLCCTEFVPGADLGAVDWKLEGQANVDYGALMQAIADFSGTATAMVTDVSNACQAIAMDLGAQGNEVTATAADQKATDWCKLAADSIAAKLGQVNLNIDFQPPVCSVNASVQANCEAKCSGNVSCEVTPAQIIARCDPGKLSGKCSAQCTGSCEGTANLAVTCEGSCQGTCEGQCMGNCSATDSGGACAGRCDGTCSGTCRGSCAVDAGAMVQCEGQCTGGCSVEVTAPKCTAELSPPSAECSGNVDCGASCQASASAKAECTEPSLNIEASAGVEDVIATLKVNLPKLLVVAKGKGQLVLDNAQVIASASGSISIDGPKAVACLIPAGSAIAASVKNIQASLSGSVNVMGKIGI